MSYFLQNLTSQYTSPFLQNTSIIKKVENSCTYLLAKYIFVLHIFFLTSKLYSGVP